MGSPTRNFSALVGICGFLGTYAVWGFIAYVAIPLFGVIGGAFGRLATTPVMPAIILAALFVASGWRGAETLWRQTWASRRLSVWIQTLALPPTPELRGSVELSGLIGRVTLVDSGEPFSFVYGVLVPRVAISRGFLELLTAQELRAALEHERYHVRNLDPFRALTGKLLSEAFFLLPSLKVLRERYEVARELAADRRAEHACGTRALLGALLKAVEGPEGGPVLAAGLAESAHLDARISRLESREAPRLPLASYSSLAYSALGACAFIFVFLSAMIGLGGTSALARAAAYEISEAGVSLDALCIAPVLLAALSYWRLARRACRPLPSTVARA